MIYETHTKIEHVGQQAFHLDCLVDFESSVDQLFTEIGEHNFEALCPYFGVLWPPAKILSEYLIRLGELVFHDKKVLELGCGLALPSIVTSSLGAKVTASDWHPDVPVLLAKNLRQNGLNQISYRRADWFSEPKELADLGYFDVIIGSDVLYAPEHPQGLCTIIEKHLAPNGVVFIADANRSYAAEFAAVMENMGFFCQISRQSVTANLPRQSTAEILVKIYEFQRI